MLLQVQKKNFIENIIPIIISLKTVVEKNKIPALRELMTYLRVKMTLCFVVSVSRLQLITQDLSQFTMEQLAGDHRNSKCYKKIFKLDQPDRSLSGRRERLTVGSSEVGSWLSMPLSLCRADSLC